MGTVLSIERCALHDGPGLRTAVFLKGCPLTCLWCHNPESHRFNPQLFFYKERCTNCGTCHCANHVHSHAPGRKVNFAACVACGSCIHECPANALEIKGHTMSAQAVVDEVLKDVRFYKKSGGGLTISGGEPFSQLDFTLEILKLAKSHGIHNCVETSGFGRQADFLAAAPYVDLFLFDYKESCPDNHKKFTGVDFKNIIANLEALSEAGAKIILRCPIIPTCNDRPDHLAAIGQLASRLKGITAVNIMAYHPMGASKSTGIGQDYPLANVGFPTQEAIDGWLTTTATHSTKPVTRG